MIAGVGPAVFEQPPFIVGQALGDLGINFRVDLSHDLFLFLLFKLLRLLLALVEGVLDLADLLVDGIDVIGPELTGFDSDDIAFEFIQRGRGGHRLAEGEVAFVGGVTIGSEHTNDERHLGDLQILADVADEAGHEP